MDPAKDSSTSEECACTENYSANNPECAVVPFARLGGVGLKATSQEIHRQQEERDHPNPESQGRFKEINHVLDDKRDSVVDEIRDYTHLAHKRPHHNGFRNALLCDESLGKRREGDPAPV